MKGINNLGLMYEKETEGLLKIVNQAFYLEADSIVKWNPSRPKEHFKTEGYYQAWKNRWSNKNPGSTLKSGYKCIRFTVAGRTYQVLYHRLVFALYNEKWPQGLLDHEDGDISNNNIANLLESNHSNNSKNLSLRSNSRSGILGVNWDSSNETWKVQGTLDYKNYHICRTKDFFEACCQRKSWEVRQGFSENHSRENVNHKHRVD